MNVASWHQGGSREGMFLLQQRKQALAPASASNAATAVVAIADTLVTSNITSSLHTASISYFKGHCNLAKPISDSGFGKHKPEKTYL